MQVGLEFSAVTIGLAHTAVCSASATLPLRSLPSWCMRETYWDAVSSSWIVLSPPMSCNMPSSASTTRWCWRRLAVDLVAYLGQGVGQLVGAADKFVQVAAVSEIALDASLSLPPTSPAWKDTLVSFSGSPLGRVRPRTITTSGISAILRDIISRSARALGDRRSFDDRTKSIIGVIEFCGKWRFSA